MLWSIWKAMPLDTLHITHFPDFGSLSYRRWAHSLSYLTILVLVFLIGCAPLVLSPPHAPFTQAETAQLISDLRAEGRRISSFHGAGRLRYRDSEEESELNLLAVGGRPFKVRIEISHPWGRPLFFIVLDGDNTSVLSLVDHKFFKGQSNRLPMDLFFLLRLDLDSIWQILSGNVPVLPHSKAASLKPYEVTLYNGVGEVTQVISFFPRSLLPRSIFFPCEGITIMLSDFKQGDFAPRPLKIEIVRKDKNQSVQIRYKNLTRNRPIPEELFSLNPPAGFEVIELNE
ncbi:MAG: hypothetical protein JRJ77_06595 [Deltaproteobacteria bacterium]|nr:hypothetical protein [Deltaproteobacteria bacterium]